MFNECGIYFANLTFDFTSYNIYCLQKPAENYKSYGQAPNYASFLRIL